LSRYSYELDAWGLILGRVNKISFVASGDHPACYQMCTGGFFPPRVKMPGREADHST
jgi:hypothetical protein